MTKIRCGNRENDKYIDGIRDLTVPWEAGLAKNWARDARFMFACLSGMPETFKNTRKFKISIERINLHLKFISFCRKLDFLMYFSEKKKSGIRETDEKRGGCGILAKKGRECGIRTPPSRPCCLSPEVPGAGKDGEYRE